jgi:pimeloyl-ACP methyl ester carboxylesterase
MALTFVLLPGLDGTGKLFTRFIQALNTSTDDIDVRVIAYPTDEPLGYEALEVRIRSELPKDRSFILLGESFSGPIAIRIAATPPPGLAALILCGTFAKNPYPLLGWASSLAFLVPMKSLPRWVRAPLMWSSRNDARVPPRAARAIAAVDGAVVRRRIAALLTVDATESLPRITVPALVIYAKQDRVVSYAATRWLLDHLPAAEVAPVDAPHLLLQAAPHECAAAVTAFLERCLMPAESISMPSA